METGSTMKSSFLEKIEGKGKTEINTYMHKTQLHQLLITLKLIGNTKHNH